MAKGIGFPGLRKLSLLLVVFVLVLATAVLLLEQNLYSMILALQRADYFFVLLALFAYLIGLVFWTLRWRITLSTVGYLLRMRNIYLVILGGIFINNVTPFTYAGGDPFARSYILKKTQKVPYSCGLATILTEFIIDFPIYFSLIALGILLSVYWTSLWYLIFVVTVWMAILVGWSWIFTKVLSRAAGARLIAGALSRVMKFFRKSSNKLKLKKTVERFYSKADCIVTNRRVVVYVILLSVVLWIFAISRLYFIFLAFRYTPPLHMLVFAVTLPAIVGMIPVLPGGLGTVDATIASVFLVFGTPLGIAISATLIERAITLVFSTFVGAGSLSYLGIKYRNTTAPKARRK